MLSRSPRLPKGPKRRPLIGSLPELARDPLGLLEDLSRHGRVSYTTIGLAKLYMLNEPELIEDALIGRAKDCIKDPGTRELIPLVGQGLLTSEGELWRRQRKLASPPLSPKRIASYADTMVASAERAFAALGRSEERDFTADMMKLALEIVGKTLLGVDASADAARIASIVDVSMAYFDKQLRTWEGILPQWVITPERRAFRKVLPELDAIIFRIIERCRHAGADADHLLARLVNARDEQGAAMSDAQLRDETVTMLLAGHETTALTLSYCAYLLAQNPKAAARARGEVDAALGARSATLADLARMPYIEAVVKEALRLYPPAWIIGREVVEPFELDGWALPKGVGIMMSPYIQQRDPRWFPEPTCFRPERWLPPDAQELPRFAYFPFGGGPRVCIGNHFAMMEAQLVLATLLRTHELHPVSDYHLKLAPLVTLRPASGVRVRLQRR